MEDKEILETLTKIITPFVRNTEALASLNASTRFVDDLDINSSRLVDTALKLEDEFDITIEDDEIDNLQTVGDTIKLIQSKK